MAGPLEPTAFQSPTGISWFRNFLIEKPAERQRKEGFSPPRGLAGSGTGHWERASIPFSASSFQSPTGISWFRNRTASRLLAKYTWFQSPTGISWFRNPDVHIPAGKAAAGFSPPRGLAG